MSIRAQNVTRGKGILEPLLASLRAKQADKLIPDSLRSGRILDIGCGSFPYFLSHTSFQEKFAVERQSCPPSCQEIVWHNLDLNQSPTLPFADKFFSVITMLAVVEHLNPQSLVGIFKEAHRSLIDDGMLIVTTPAAWSDGLLHFMAHTGLVSHEEIHEHVYAYTLPLLGWYFGGAGFRMEHLDFGYFECHLNMWATARR